MVSLRACVCLVLGLPCIGRSLSHGAAAALRDDSAARGEYTLNLQPPEEDASEVDASLDAILKVEQAKSLASDETFHAERARMLAVEKSKLDALVRESLEPLLRATDSRLVGFVGNGRGPPRPAGFLASPVDSDRIRNSLYLSQPLRSPPQATVNVVMQEDVRGMQDHAKYAGAREQTARLMAAFHRDLDDMAASAP